ncbi:MAG TPA: indole-3-glycerol phosphate synthase TrpC [Solirubrobacteraceae bacterium]|jgi:indole-3-glycerol phosphate synthase|nr:indole-3-glycerol phosphate synthase TrpC [Solirubrobacteraceae bacterium]
MSVGTPNVLDRILAETRREVERRKRAQPLAEPAPAAQGDTGAAGDTGAPGAREGRFEAALRAPGIGVIAEFKRRSPSAGSLRAESDVEEIVGAYARGGAVALSVLTEGPNFGGSLADLRAAAAACELPRLRKDFIVDPYQLREALANGADAVLLIVAALDQPQLSSLHEAAAVLGLDVLVEVHDGRELAQALEAGARIVGVNNRDLTDFSVDVQRTQRLIDEVPDGVVVISESGIARAEQLEQLEQLGVAAVLVGEALMRAEDPEAALRALRGL